MASESDWLFESVQQFLQSPSWALPVMSFIDENCIIFDHEDENKLAYMEIYEAFKEMVDSLLELHLSEMGVSQSQFFQTLAKNPHAKRSKQILEQLLVIDDFLSFKKMMGKRNAELEAEVLNMIKNYADPPSPICGADDDYDYELQLERAMKLSIFEARVDVPVGQSDLDAVRRAQEQAELEMVLAMSLQLEEARANELKIDASLEAAIAASAAEAEALAAAQRADAEAEVAAIAALEQDAADADAKAAAESKAKAAAAAAVEAHARADAEMRANAAARAEAEAAAQAKEAQAQEARALAEAAAQAKEAQAQEARALAEAEARAKEAADAAAAALVTKSDSSQAAAALTRGDSASAMLPSLAGDAELAGAVKAARQAEAEVATAGLPAEPSAATRAVADLDASKQSLFSSLAVMGDPGKATANQMANLKRAEEAATRAAEARKREQTQRLTAALPVRPSAGVALAASLPASNAALDAEIEVKKRAEHMRRQRELLLLQKRNQALSAVQSGAGAGYSAGGAQGLASTTDAGGSVSASMGASDSAHSFLAAQRKELEDRLQKDEAAKAAELARIQKQKASLNAMLLKPLM